MPQTDALSYAFHRKAGLKLMFISKNNVQKVDNTRCVLVPAPGHSLSLFQSPLMDFRGAIGPDRSLFHAHQSSAPTVIHFPR